MRRALRVGVALLIALVLLVIIVVIFPGFVRAVAYALGWLVGHIVKLFAG